MDNLFSIRKKHIPKVPNIINAPMDKVHIKFGHSPTPPGDVESIKKTFQKSYGQKTITFSEGQESKKEHKPISAVVVLSGGQAPGGHNVIAGVYDAIMKWNKESRLYGAIGGPDGLVQGTLKQLDGKLINEYRNTGGFDIIGSGRGKITTQEQFKMVASVCKKKGISVIVIIGGDDSNTNAAHLAEYFLRHDELGVTVVGCPKTIDGDLKNSSIETSFGFDTATKTYSELIGNIARDAISARKYWFFIRLMGRSASHVALECALQTQPNICLIGEEIKKNNTTLAEVIDSVANVIEERARAGKNYGVCLVPEGIVEFIPDVSTLIKEINTLLAKQSSGATNENNITQWLTKQSAQCFKAMPEEIQKSLLAERDPHGNVQVSKIQSEILLGSAIEKRMKEKELKFSPIYNFFGYEGRSAFPSNFDASYCYALGYNAILLATAGVTGYMSTIQGLVKKTEKWKLGGIPIVSMFTLEERHGQSTPVIKKALVDLEGGPFKKFAQSRERWAKEDAYLFPGPIQYFGPDAVSNTITKTLEAEFAKN